MNTTPYLSVNKVSAHLDYHPESVRRLIRAGKLPALRIGKRLRISTADVEAFEMSHRVASRADLRAHNKVSK